MQYIHELCTLASKISSYVEDMDKLNSWYIKYALCIHAGDSYRNSILKQSSGTSILLQKYFKLMHLPSQNGSRSPCIHYTPKGNRLQFEKICKYIKFIQSRFMPPWQLISLPYDIPVIDVTVVDAATEGLIYNAYRQQYCA